MNSKDQPRVRLDKIINSLLNGEHTKDKTFENLAQLCKECFSEDYIRCTGIMWHSIMKLMNGDIDVKFECYDSPPCVLDRLMKEYRPQHYKVHGELYQISNNNLRYKRMQNVDPNPKKNKRVMFCVPHMNYACGEVEIQMGQDLTWNDLDGIFQDLLQKMKKNCSVEKMIGVMDWLIEQKKYRFSLYPIWIPHGPWKELIDTSKGTPLLTESIDEHITVYPVMTRSFLKGSWFAFRHGLRKCGHCGKMEGAREHEGLKTCTGCDTEAYCGRECQRAAWATHRAHCTHCPGAQKHKIQE